MSWFWNKENKQGNAGYKNILFVSAPLSAPDSKIETYDYFAGIAAELALRLYKDHKEYDLVLKVPNARLAKEQQIEFIDRAIKSPERYQCIIVSPVDRENMKEEMKGWIKAYSADKIFMVDQGFTPDDCLELHQQSDRGCPPYVQADWKHGGWVAAESMFKAFNQKSVTAPHIVILKGGVGSPERIDGFLQFMEEKKGSDFTYTKDDLYGDYSRRTAMEVFENHLELLISAGRTVDGVFATNDEMALGAREAFKRYKESYMKMMEKRHHNSLPVIVGFDGIRDVTRLIDEKDELLYDTVDVQLKLQINTLVDLIERLVIKPKKNDKTKIKRDNNLKCRSYRNKPKKS